MHASSLVCLLLAVRCSAQRSCTRADVVRSESPWTFDTTGCEKLDLGGHSGTSIGAVGAAALAKALKTNSAITSLSLFYNAIGTAGAEALADALKTNNAITGLNLASNSIGAAGARALAEALKTNKALTNLNLMHNAIADEGARALAGALRSNSVLTDLYLGSNSMTDDGAWALAEALKTNKALINLDVGTSNSIGDEAQKAVDELLAVPPKKRHRKAKAEAKAARKAEAEAEAARAHALHTFGKRVGLLPILDELEMDDDDKVSVLSVASAWFDKVGATSIREVVDNGRIDELVRALYHQGLPRASITLKALADKDEL